ncbi:class I adenylate-forming enzyme family protein [Streptacidiphilus jiangxiensis]|uniref:Acyl-CoA synthetase (AMP-forming)/AMP-acid ligase II n=1 Tax=Streptacidiphilus jiangxiensis TaxID=235985 RepID=A0A1H7VPG6_STRJI|nr:long-chain fatty acid--CoA ligase [Streptacidiphilus jiangxiensis]SEM10697.1 Acyl-CoA synthetase (AMP-forming)/AMP-acid ligase II [Streptacidiphilus jiangxiensis]
MPKPSPFTESTLRPSAAREELAGRRFGGGNAWRVALETSDNPEATALVVDRPLLDAAGEEREFFSLAGLNALAEAWSAWYHAQGVRPRDRVVVWLEDTFEDQVHLTALAQIGAIAVLLNGRMVPEFALALIERAAPVGLYTDSAHLELLQGRHERTASLRWTTTRRQIGALTAPALPAEAWYAHQDEDPVVLCHTSGTTGVPKLVVWTHRQSVAGARFRLASHPEPADSVMLSAIAQSHSGAIAFTYYALLAGLPLISVADRSPAGVTKSVAAYRPTTVLAFHQTFAALVESDPDPADFASVADWMNTGDSAHDAHIRELIKLGRRTVEGKEVLGSVFGDALGASELGWAALRRVVTGDSPQSPRYLGKPVALAEVAVLREDGSPAADSEVGLLAVRSESLSPGYWNDSDTYYRGRLGGWKLTGDLAYRTGDDDFFHVDREIDRIRTRDGDGYSVLMEETLLLALPEISDCAVAAGQDGELTVPVAIVRPRRTEVDPQELLARANQALAEQGQPSLALLELASETADIPVGPTEKVLKRQLRERYVDLRGYAATRPSRHVAMSGQ